jgi:hypothetical protein
MLSENPDFCAIYSEESRMRLLVVFFGFLPTVTAHQELTVIPWPAKKLSK